MGLDLLGPALEHGRRDQLPDQREQIDFLLAPKPALPLLRRNEAAEQLSGGKERHGDQRTDTQAFQDGALRFRFLRQLLERHERDELPLLELLTEPGEIGQCAVVRPVQRVRRIVGVPAPEERHAPILTTEQHEYVDGEKLPHVSENRGQRRFEPLTGHSDQVARDPEQHVMEGQLALEAGFEALLLRDIGQQPMPDPGTAMFVRHQDRLVAEPHDSAVAGAETILDAKRLARAVGLFFLMECPDPVFR
ncbi:hypothetical protein HRbin27_01508 [bacterium HR27]|nr:hypothetical protein HRbin27_01508 [bacterium HR27]